MSGSEQPTIGRAALATALGGMFRAFLNTHVHNDPHPVQFDERDQMIVVTRATGTFSCELFLLDGKTISGTGRTFNGAFSTTTK